MQDVRSCITASSTAYSVEDAVIVGVNTAFQVLTLYVTKRNVGSAGDFQYRLGAGSYFCIVGLDETRHPEDLSRCVSDYPEQLLVMGGEVMVGEDVTEEPGVALHAERSDAIRLLPATEGERSGDNGGVKVGDVRVEAWSGFGDGNLLDAPLDGTHRERLRLRGGEEQILGDFDLKALLLIILRERMDEVAGGVRNHLVGVFWIDGNATCIFLSILLNLCVLPCGYFLQMLHGKRDAVTRLWQDLLHERKELVADLITQGIVLQVAAVGDIREAILCQIIKNLLAAEAK